MNRMTFAAFDPYYILGVDRKMDYEEIKKNYYKLASQYHPDKNSSPDAKKQFIAIKEAFEIIKGQRGKGVKIDEGSKSSRDQNFQSVRPNPEQYREDFKEEFQDTETGEKMDYKERFHSTPESEEYSKLKTSFKEMDMMRNIKFNPDNVDIPDPSKRFDLKSQSLLKRTFSEGNPSKFVLVVVSAFCILVYLALVIINKATESKYEIQLYNLLNKKEYEREIEVFSDDKKKENITLHLKKKKEFQEFERKSKDVSKHFEYIRDRHLPKFIPYVDLKDVEEQSANNLS